MPKLFDLINELASRGVGHKGIGQGSTDAQAASLILLAIDNLTTAAQADEEGAPIIWKAIDVLKSRYQSQQVDEKKTTESFSKTEKVSDPPQGSNGDQEWQKKKSGPQQDQKMED
jgi:hypothetical protein